MDGPRCYTLVSFFADPSTTQHEMLLASPRELELSYLHPLLTDCTKEDNQEFPGGDPFSPPLYSVSMSGPGGRLTDATALTMARRLVS